MFENDVADLGAEYRERSAEQQANQEEKRAKQDFLFDAVVIDESKAG
jgi:hypothetical protein